MAGLGTHRVKACPNLPTRRAIPVSATDSNGVAEKYAVIGGGSMRQNALNATIGGTLVRSMP
jgi:hypothetical protein